MKAKDIPEFSVVRYRGKLGVLHHRTASGKPWFVRNTGAGKWGEELSRNTELEVVKYPARLAQEYIEREEE
jgi:hypothetical protein